MKVGLYNQRILVGQRKEEDVQIIPRFIDNVSSLLSNTSPIEEHNYLLGKENIQLQYYICPTFNVCVIIWPQTNLFVFYLTSLKQLPVRDINNLIMDYFNTDKFEYSARTIEEIASSEYSNASD